MFRHSFFVLTAALSLCAQSAHAQILAIQTANNTDGGSYTIPENQTYGWKFTVGESPISVTHLGIYDAGANGLIDSHQIGIWNSGGTLLVEGTVPSDPGLSTLDTSYRFVLVSPVTLEAGMEYYIGAHSPQPNDPVLILSQQTFGSEITFNSASYPSASGFSPPLNSYSVNQGVFGPNFIYSPVPEPAEYAAFTSLALAGFVLFRKYRARPGRGAA